MKGAIIFYSKYGSTEQYASWIAASTGLPKYSVKNRQVDPSNYDFLILGCPIIYYKLPIRKWVMRHLEEMLDKPVIFFTVSGAPAGEKLNGWISDSLPAELVSHMHHVALRGRQNPKELTLYDRMMLKIGGMMNRDREARRQEMQGFDFMDKNSIEPILELVEQLQPSGVPS